MPRNKYNDNTNNVIITTTLVIITPKAISERPTIYRLEITLKIQLIERPTQPPTTIANQTPSTQVTLAPSKEPSYKLSTNKDIIFI